MTDLQKKRNSTKKVKSNKSQAVLQIPLGPLIEEINQLKSELASIKSKKNIKSLKESQNGNQKQLREFYTQINSGKPDFKGDKTTPKLTLQPKNKDGLKEIIFPIKENQLKMNLELNKIYQWVKENNEIRTISTLNKLISYLNNSIKDLDTDQRSKEQIAQQQTSYNSKSEQMRLYQQLNIELEKENIELKHALAKQMDEIEELRYFNAEIKQEFDLIEKSLNDAQDQLQKTNKVCVVLREERRELEEKIKVFERSIEKKQSQILLYQEDLNFIKMQSQKVKIQKRETQKLLDSLQKQYRDLKNKNEIEIQALRKEKNKWKNQCESRRTSESVLIGQQQQKTQLKKEVDVLRKEYNTLTQQLCQTKQKLCEQQKRNLLNEEINFKLQNQKDKLERSLQYCKSEIRELAAQVDQLQEESLKYRDLAIKSKMGIKNNSKAQALHEIQQMIKLHRTNDSYME